MNNYRTCYTCGASYSYCPTCGGSSKQPGWMLLWDTEECKDVFNILSAYNMNQVSKEEVQKVLNEYNVKDFNKYNEDIKAQLTKMFPSVRKSKIVDVD